MTAFRTLYRIEHATHAKAWCAIDQTKPEDGFWSAEDDFLVEFDDEDDAFALAEKVGGEVIRFTRISHIGRSSRYLLGAGKEN